MGCERCQYRIPSNLSQLLFIIGGIVCLRIVGRFRDSVDTKETITTMNRLQSCKLI